MNVISTQVFGPIQLTFSGTLSLEGQNKTEEVNGTYNGFEILPSDFILTTEHMGKDETECW